MLKLINFIFVILALLSSNSFLIAQEGGEQSAEMQAWMEYMTPGPMHEMMAKSVGDWKTINKFWMDPAGDPMIVEGTDKTEMILGGRYQKSIHKSTMMGMETEGISITGYDNATQEFTAIWIDNIGTGTAITKGKYDESTNSILMEGSMVDPMTKQEMEIREVLTFVDYDHHLFVMYIVSNGDEFKSMEIEFVRQ